MADDTFSNGEETPEEEKQAPDGDSGMLPPLSDAFESSEGAGFQSDSGLPPLGSLDLDAGAGAGGLPAIEDLAVEVPDPTGGAIKPPPPGFEGTSSGPEEPGAGGDFVTPPPAQATPEPIEPTPAGTGFQDLSADSDFSPAAPDVGPGPDSGIETPMFDSAFGPSDSEMGMAGTPAPTQAMDTPAFGGSGAGTPGGDGTPGFDEGAFDFGGDSGFGAPGGFGGESGSGGTPVPDFSPDTGAPAMGAPEMAPTATPEPVAAVPVEAGQGKGGPGWLLAIGIGLAAVILGIVAGPFVARMVTFLPNPTATELAEANGTIADLQGQVRKLVGSQEDRGEAETIFKETERLINERNELKAGVKELTEAFEASSQKFSQLQSDLSLIEEDVEAKNEEYIESRDKYEELVNQMAIVKARHTGLLAEVDRLTGRVGELDDANARRVASKEALEHDIERLAVMVKEAIPLTPDRYSQTARLAAIEDLKAKAGTTNWVTPALLNEYTTLYQREVEIGSATAYFFANVPVTDKYGTRLMKWAECLMVGRWAVYYRTLDGKNIGSYENVADEGPPRYAFREDLIPNAKKEIEQRIFDSRTEGFETKVEMLAGKQQIRQGESAFQRVFDSL